MAPIRRYLRITKYSVLECRIYLDNPALAQSWLLNPRDPILPKVIESVRPLVLPKLREEKERERSKKKNKKRSIKDVVVEDDFEVSIFLTETDTRHSLLHKTKLFRDKIQTRLTSNSSKLMGASQDEPIDLDDGAYAQGTAAAADVPIRLEEEDDGDAVANLADIPMADGTPARSESTNRRPKRRRDPRGHGHESEGAHVEVVDSDSSGDKLFEGDDGDGGSSEDEAEDEDDSDDAGTRQPPSKRRRETAPERDDKKKMALDISYEGFAIYGRVLCLVVKRRGDGGGGPTGGGTSAARSGSNKSQTAGGRPGGQAILENWIESTQLPDPAAEDAEDE
ncbi:hypothetical protein C8A05DRAFT_13076 [Staphylotrichum tortipilum]|uniref:Uncharacterized protein n=1 Tax=Staphylotrichum tortipilum TaxID=2831512 RepID=A0AAN6MRG1_9PEZI|nr:hypothetical protein C8A05DRAFT_13076 [Staphylotrichum longicolle]